MSLFRPLCMRLPWDVDCVYCPRNVLYICPFNQNRCWVFRSRCPVACIKMAGDLYVYIQGKWFLLGSVNVISLHASNMYVRSPRS